jgi:hypothetical protein
MKLLEQRMQKIDCTQISMPRSNPFLYVIQGHKVMTRTNQRVIINQETNLPGMQAKSTWSTVSTAFPSRKRPLLPKIRDFSSQQEYFLFYWIKLMILLKLEAEFTLL